MSVMEIYQQLCSVLPETTKCGSSVCGLKNLPNAHRSLNRAKYFQLVAAFKPDGKASGLSSFNSLYRELARLVLEEFWDDS